MAAENGFSQVANGLVMVRYLDKLVQPSYTLFALTMPLAMPKAS